MESLNVGFARFTGLLNVAEDFLARGNLAAAACLANMAARTAFPRHMGIFASPRLEQLLLKLAKHLTSSPASIQNRKTAGKLRHVLHVLTYAREVGGDTRFVWRWMELDEHSRHSVVLTAQEEVKKIHEIPVELTKAAERSGGFVKVLNGSSADTLDKAQELRALCQTADIVILHLFPYDIIPVLALASGCESVKVAFANLADHSFWIGSSVANQIIHLRTQSESFLARRRGLNPSRSSIVPIPLGECMKSAKRDEARRLLRLPARRVILLTIASPFKYDSLGEHGFLDLVFPVLQRLSNALLVAVGPEFKGAWLRASVQTNGRVIALGTRWDNELLYAAADVYLDSVPFSSITSLLEAGSYGVPLLGLAPTSAECELLGPGAPGLDDAMELAPDPDTYRFRLTRLIENEEYRKACGQRIRASIAHAHSGPEWKRSIELLYEKLERGGDERCLVARNDTFENGGLDTAVGRLYSRVPIPRVRNQIQDYLGSLPYSTRLKILSMLRREGFTVPPLSLFPPFIEKPLRLFGRQVKSFLRPMLAKRHSDVADEVFSARDAAPVAEFQALLLSAGKTAKSILG